MDRELTNDSAEKGILVRILSGRLKGCEYLLKTEKTLIIVSGPQEGHAGVPPSLPDDCIFIPDSEAEASVELIHDGAAPAQLRVREVAEQGGGQDTVVAANQIFQIGPLSLAWRAVDEPWADAVLNPQAGNSDRLAITGGAHPRRLAAILCAVSAIVMMAYGLYAYYSSDTHQRKRVALAGQLAEEPDKFHIVQGRDGIMYALAWNAADAAWGKQSVVRLGTSVAVKVLSTADEQRDIYRWLNQFFPFLSLHRIEVDQPSQPVIVLSQQRSALSPQQQAQLKHGLMQALPYISDIVLTTLDDQVIAAQAEAGVKKISVHYERINNPDNVTFVIKGDLDDGQLQLLNRYIDSYYHRWNGRYVQFAIELKDNWLRDKSFRYGPQGYIKVSAGHWYFSPPR